MVPRCHLSISYLTFQYVVHELMPLPSQYKSTMPNELEWSQWPVNHNCEGQILHPCELKNGKNITFDEKNKHWSLVDGKLSVFAGPIPHRVPTFGYVFTESPKPGKLLVDKLCQLSVPKNIKQGISVALEDGRYIRAECFLGPEQQGRKVAVIQVTCDAFSGMSKLCADCDVIVHEATNCEADKEQCHQHGHSTPLEAAKFAFNNVVNGRHLILTHFSQRYKDEGSVTDDNKKEVLTTKILKEEASKIFNTDNITCAYEGLLFPVKYKV